MASIKKYKLKSGIEKWYFQVFAGKNPKTGKKNIIMRRGFNSEEEARKEAIILESEVIRGTASVVGRQIKIAQYLNDWITKYKKNVKEGTMIIYRYNLKKYIIPQIGEFILSKYTLREHQDFIDSLLDQGLSINTVKLINGTVSNAMKKAIAIGYIERNPTTGVEFNQSSKYNDQKKLHFWNKDQIDTFIATAQKEREPMWLPFFLIMIDEGLRIGEVMALQWSDISFESNTISINKTRIYRAEKGENVDKVLVDRPKTPSSIREVIMTARVSTLLKQLYQIEFSENDVTVLLTSTQNNDGMVFVYTTSEAKRGQPVKARGASSAFVRIVKRSGLPHIRIHDLRHTHAVLMRESGLSLDDIKDDLGHKNVATTEIYAEISPTKKSSNHQKFERYLNNEH
ncbi:site-specific integrase [Lacticaseibacillus saniviri]|uniref:Phage-related integrase n=2 Tax=Lacticaseibacillus saniviri TaxID=931533 RepID=A0A0R2MRD6_9LACO|nr:site-specific integrase [Lacticaseibacillus saniviri]KRO16175.1 phage-related integrase [Lacticaseibacillus saniviri JCM 17471 = DSM 24301]